MSERGESRKVRLEFREGDSVLANTIGSGHAEACRATPIYRKDTGELATHVLGCVKGCAHRERAIKRGQELAERFGW